jgi:hypothetical protein
MKSNKFIIDDNNVSLLFLGFTSSEPFEYFDLIFGLLHITKYSYPIEKVHE